MGSRGFRRLVPVLVLVGALTFVLGSASAGGSKGMRRGVQPNAVNLADCNGWSKSYTSLKPGMRGLCTDPVQITNGHYSRLFDNGWYVGHDEPSVKFISSAPNSGNTMTYLMQLAVDPKEKPTPDGRVTDYAELSIAPWFGLPMCDPKSYPQNPCTPDSDTNIGTNSPAAAGSAFMELQFYAPGFGPFADAPSCDPTHYCAAMTIDSLECTLGFGFCNPNCEEPVNFAYLQRNGVPAGPPSPQLANDETINPNGQTLLMNPGDALRVTIADTRDGLREVVQDLTTGQSGFMVASKANGFMNTDLHTCEGTPFAFHPEYNTARQQNQVPWAALEGGVLMQQEIGHFESCNSVSEPLGLLPFDPQTFWTCRGGLEPGRGEGPCAFTTFTCTGATTEGGGPCMIDFPNGLCEYSDAPCMPKGPRPVQVNGRQEIWSWPVAGCSQLITQNGDLDFDGNSYRPDWPDGSSQHPTTFKYAGPFDPAGNPYPSVQFETNVGGSENDCNTATGEGCTALPHNAAFYPFWTIGPQSSGFPGMGQACLWNFGNRIAGVTTSDFGGVAEYGAPDTARFGGTLTSPVRPNPQLSSSCRA
jgi:hypothetical protein